MLAASLRYRGVQAASVSGQTGRQERRDIIERFKNGEIQVLANCDLLIQGFDAPGVRALYIARPTFSPNAYIQMAGRGLRGPENGGKEECLIVDMADNFGDMNDFLGYREYEDLWKEQRAMILSPTSPTSRDGRERRRTSRRAAAASSRRRPGCGRLPLGEAPLAPYKQQAEADFVVLWKGVVVVVEVKGGGVRKYDGKWWYAVDRRSDWRKLRSRRWTRRRSRCIALRDILKEDGLGWYRRRGTLSSHLTSMICTARSRVVAVALAGEGRDDR